MVHILRDLHEAGIFEKELSYDKVDNILFRIVLEDSTEYAEFSKLPRGNNPKDTGNPKLYAGNYRYNGAVGNSH